MVKSSTVYYHPHAATATGSDDPLAADAFFAAAYAEFESRVGRSVKSPWLLRLVLDRYRVNERGLCMRDVQLALSGFYRDTLSTAFSDDNSDALVVRIQLRNKAASDTGADCLTELLALEKTLMTTGAIRGIPRVEKAVADPRKRARFSHETSEFVTVEEPVLETAGSNLIEILKNPYVDARRTRTNDVQETYRVLGIEAARQSLFNEIAEVMGVETPVNARHLTLLVDCMTHRGYLMPIDRHGINRAADIGPLAKCSFEETDKVLEEAGMLAEVDRVDGVSANIMLGQVPPCGTGMSEILVDSSALPNRRASAAKVSAAAPGTFEFDFDFDVNR